MRFLIYIAPILLLFSCKKDQCWNGYGSETSIDIPLTKAFDSIVVNDDIHVEIVQDSMNFIRLKTGSNIAKNVLILEEGNFLTLGNTNKCNFLRSNDKKTTIEIHQSSFEYMYFSTSGNITFLDTVTLPSLTLYYEFGGGEMDVLVNTGYLKIVCYNGSGNYNVAGTANFADLRVQMSAWGDASELKANNYSVFSNTTGDLKLNLDSSFATVTILGTGNVLYSGEPDSLIIVPTKSAGMCLPE